MWKTQPSHVRDTREVVTTCSQTAGQSKAEKQLTQPCEEKTVPDHLPFDFDKGAHFVVLLFEEYVIKVPFKEEYRSEKRVSEIVEMQNAISKHIDCVYPAKQQGLCIVTRRAPGVKVSKLPKDQQTKLKARGKLIDREVAKHGYKIGDISAKNMVYNQSTDELYLVDFSMVKRVRG